ncbi:MAG: VOC family protein [Acidobacteria bacterium]|nr:VOC family protein [Acidobacteriota bacterium]MBI3655989.1 VOC family protein [Acidobacteriota bacterium]
MPVGNRRCDHLALKVKDLERTIAFYRDYVGMQIIHDRREREHRVVWMRLPDDLQGLILVMIEDATPASPGGGSVDHLGIHVDNRAEVDAIAERAAAVGILIEPPQYAGPVVGYFCTIRDPDGNAVEFSCEQMRL